MLQECQVWEDVAVEAELRLRKLVCVGGGILGDEPEQGARNCKASSASAASASAVSSSCSLILRRCSGVKCVPGSS